MIKYYLPLAGIYYCIKDHEFLFTTHHFDITTMYHSLMIATGTVLGLIAWMF